MSTLAPLIRSQFAKRLKVIRTQKGFNRARYFASTLGIEENRYTRYERAEVEPSLTLIHKMCETLNVTPNELLGFDGDRAVGPMHGFAESGSGSSATKPDAPVREPLSALAWSLAAEMVAVRREQDPGRKATVDPLEAMRETGGLYRGLLAEPFETTARLADDPLLAQASAQRKAEIAHLMARFTDALRGRD